MSTPHASPIPLTLLTAFLGSGKTTLLNRILHGDHGLRVAVLVNDFGEINIDAQLVVGVEGEDMINLSNGCICCTIRGDLLQAILQLLARPEKPEYILIEASGVSDPASIAVTFTLPEIRPYLQLDSIITVVDAEQVRTLTGYYAELAVEQIAVADIILLNKIDLVEDVDLLALKDWIGRIIPRARIIETVHAQAPLELLLGVGAYNLDRLLAKTPRDVHVHAVQAHDHDHEHEHDHERDHEHEHEHHHEHGDHTLVFNTFSYTNARPFSLKAIRQVITTLPAGIFRAKGFLHIQDRPEIRVVLHVVGSRARLLLGEPWGDQRPFTQIVMIGEPDGFDPHDLRHSLDDALAEKSPSAESPALQTALEWLRVLAQAG